MKVICIGRNYRGHAKELNNPVPDRPIFFMKPQSALLMNNRPFFYPDFSRNIHYELELVIRICRPGKYIPLEHGGSFFDQVALGLDLTARDLQQQCKEKGLPWEIAKCFDGSAPLSPFVATEKTDTRNLAFYLLKNGEKVQESTSKEMIFDFNALISYVSQFMTLKIGDLIFTGTPAGVGPVQIGDHLEGYLNEEKLLHLQIR